MVALPLQAMAQEPPGLPLWEAGVFATGLSQQAYPGASQTINRALVLPYLSYRGQYFRSDRDGTGLRAIKTERMELDIGFAASLGASSSEIEARRGMPDLGTLVEFGPRLKWKLGDDNAAGKGSWHADLALRGVFDASDPLRDKGLSLEPSLTYEGRSAGGWGYSTSLGLVFGDQRLGDTFYGVAPAYATATRAAYTAQAGLINSYLSASAFRSLTPNLRLGGFARISSVDGAANANSPLVRQTVGGNLGLAVIYLFARSSETAKD